MKDVDWSRVRELFEQAMAMPAERRADFLADSTAGEAELRAEVDGLLQADDAAGGFLEEGCRLKWTPPVSAARPGARIAGRFEIVRVLASGGMGTVHEARQDEPRRSVALKMVHRGLVTEESRRRFRFETETLARLQHRGIAQIFETGTHREGEIDYPFFAMELVEGARNLLSYADDCGLETRRRIELFLEVCEAVHHGHQRGVIHRDLKPSNVLVDETGSPKLIDFGIARDVEREADLTRTGQVVGTLRYMSPEQLGADSLEVDTRTDIYALGCLLHELLVGRPAHDLDGLSLPQAARHLAEIEPRPPEELPRELGWILMTCLERDPRRRYSTAADLAADLRRYLGHEPVLAGPPSSTYRLRKLLRRHRIFLGTVAAVLIALAIGLVRAAEEALVARTAQAAAERETEKALGVVAFLRKMLTSVGALSHGQDARVRDVLDTAAGSLDAEFAGEPEARALVHNVISESYAELRLFEPAREHLGLAQDYLEANPEASAELRIDVLANEAFLALVTGAYPEGREAGLRAEKLALSRYGPLHERTLKVQSTLCELFYYLEQNDEAERRYDASIVALEEFYGAEHGEVIGARGGRAMVWRMQERFAEAQLEFEEVLALATRSMPAGHWRISNARLNLAALQMDMEQFAEAEASFRTVIEDVRTSLREDHPFRMGASFGLGWVLEAEGRLEESLEPYRVALEIAAATHGEVSPLSIYGHANLAGVLLDLQRHAEARPHLAFLIEHGGDDPNVEDWVREAWDALTDE